MSFDYFVGIDWSGAKGRAHRGISIFTCQKGRDVPVKTSPPAGKSAFSRADVAAYLRSLSEQGRVLAGMDFAFAYPVTETGDYFPALPKGQEQPQSAPALWALIEDVNKTADDFYGGLIWDHDVYGAYYNAPNGRKGSKFLSRRRLTEQAAAAVKSPSPTFNCVGPAGVGTGSLAGMRLCHALSDIAAIWPFTDNNEAALHLVEIFPSYYFKMAGIAPIGGAHAEIANINHALAYFNTMPVPASFKAEGPDADDADALISAAALRAFADDETAWKTPDIAKREGWIFGVK